MAKPAAFLPNPKDREASVFRHSAKPLDTLLSLGRAAASERSLYGAALVQTRAVRDLNLQVISDEPPMRHAVIRGWPWVDHDPQLQKARQKEIAALIASRATLVLFA